MLRPAPLAVNRVQTQGRPRCYQRASESDYEFFRCDQTLLILVQNTVSNGASIGLSLCFRFEDWQLLAKS
jgi:hypothetical protein